MATSTSATTTCRTYSSLKSNLDSQCLRYLAFHPQEVFGTFPGMHKEKWEHEVPSAIASDYYRGGIIGTVAIFEAYTADLLDEACELNKQRCKTKCQSKKQDDDTVAAVLIEVCHKLTQHQNSANTEQDNDIAELLKKASKLCKTERGSKNEQDDKQTCSHANLSKKLSKQIKKNTTSIQFHNWDSDYTKVLLNDKESETFTDYLFRPNNQSRPMNYTYVIQEGVYSKLKIGIRRKGLSIQDTLEHRRQQRLRSEKSEFEDESALCAMLRLFYGIRCVMAHGKSDGRLNNGVLKNWPQCTICQGNATQVTLDDSMDLDIYLQQYIQKFCNLSHKNQNELNLEKLNDIHKINVDESDVDDVIFKVFIKEAARKIDYDNRKIPEKDKFEKLHEIFKKKGWKDNEWNDILKIFDTHFPKTGPTSDKPAAFAYFHMCRILHWVKVDSTSMYITYRLLVRINQFIHMLAFRMYIAVAEILIRKHKLDNGTWGIYIEDKDDKGNIDGMIETFEKKHDEIVKKTHEVASKIESTVSEWIEKMDKKIETSDSCRVLVEQKDTEDEVIHTYVAIMKRKKDGDSEDSIIPSVKSVDLKKP